MSARDTGPSHYAGKSVQPWDVIDTWPAEQRIGFYRGNLLKYTMRMGDKDVSAQEITKAKHYAEKLLEVLKELEAAAAPIAPVPKAVRSGEAEKLICSCLASMTSEDVDAITARAGKEKWQQRDWLEFMYGNRNTNL